MESFEAEFISSYKVKMIIGKGGMGSRTTTAMKENGTVYCIFTGGAAVLAAKAIIQIKRVEWLDLGMAEALWLMEVKNFGPLIVTIDTSGRNLLDERMQDTKDNRKKIYEKFGF
jgi:fumarate hydratase subunit beta